MAGFKRSFGPKRPKGLPKGYDSWDEHSLHNGILKDADHHPELIQYTVSHKYEPDFVITLGEVEYVIEFKGYFRDSAEAAKYTWIKKHLKDNQELIFIFSKLNKPIHFRTKRVCGTKQTHEEWAVKNGFKAFDVASFTEFYNSFQVT